MIKFAHHRLLVRMRYYWDSLANFSNNTHPIGFPEAQLLNIEVLHTLSMGLDESFAGQNFVAH
jgi:hypothetical protein